MTFTVSVRVCRQHRARFGFYALINGQRLHFRRHADAVAAIRSVLEMQRLQVVTVDQYAARNRKRIANAQTTNAVANPGTNA